MSDTPSADVRLLASFNQLINEPNQDQEEALADMAQALKDGANPNALPGLKASPLSYIAKHAITLRKAGLEAMSLLLEYGANPLVGDVALLKFAQSEKQDIRNFSTYGLVERILLEQGRTGKILVDGQGRNTLHLLALHQPELFVVQLNTPSKQSDVLEAWINQVDQHGDTPGHLLWAPAGKIWQVSEEYKRNPSKENHTQWSWETRFAWTCQELLLDHGHSMEIPNNQGITALEYCRECLGQGHTLSSEKYGGVLARVEGAILERDTQKVERKSAPKSRL